MRRRSPAFPMIVAAVVTFATHMLLVQLGWTQPEASITSITIGVAVGLGFLL